MRSRTLTKEGTEKIYAFSDERYPGWLKVGMTSRRPEERVREQYATVIPCGRMPYSVVYTADAVKNDGRVFSDHDVHDMLSAKGFLRGYSEWFRCSLKDVEDAVCEIKRGVTANDIMCFRGSVGRAVHS